MDGAKQHLKTGSQYLGNWEKSGVIDTTADKDGPAPAVGS